MSENGTDHRPKCRCGRYKRPIITVDGVVFDCRVCDGPNGFITGTDQSANAKESDESTL